MAFIEFRNITKAYGSFVSCSDISLKIQKGHIHSIIGENGAGKSTLVKLLGGITSPSSGSMFLNDKLYQPKSAQDAFKNKIAFIHQHFVLADQLSAIDNIVLSASSAEPSLKLRKNSEIKFKAQKVLQQFNWKINLDKTVRHLSVGEQQRLEILKALMQEPEVIIFDEPTAVLTPQESEELMQFILQLKQRQKTIILISHKLNEIKSVSDQISVLRHGRLIDSRSAHDISIEQMAELMIGRQVVKNNSIQRSSINEDLCEMPGTNLKLRRSEVFGVAGIEGNGQSELIASLLHEFKRKGLSYGDITEDRLKLSVFEEMDLCDHMLMKHQQNFIRHGIINKAKLETTTEEVVKGWDVRPQEIKKPLSEFSGGNQQKFIVGRELWHEPDVLLAAHPTRGVDLGAQEKIHEAFLNFSEKKKTVVLISSDLNELLYLSDRFVILNKKKIFGPFTKTQLNEQQIGLIMAAENNTETEMAGTL